MRTFCIYNKQTGLFTGKSFSLTNPDISIETLTKDHCTDDQALIEGTHDSQSKKVELKLDEETQKEVAVVVDYQPPPPSETSIRNEERVQALQQLQQLDARHLRALDEVHADPDNKVALDNLQSIRKLKRQLRQKLV